jgi:hypothetical protein
MLAGGSDEINFPAALRDSSTKAAKQGVFALVDVQK